MTEEMAAVFIGSSIRLAMPLVLAATGELVAHGLDLALGPAFVFGQVDQAVGQRLAQAHELVEQAVALLDDAAGLRAGLVDAGLGLCRSRERLGDGFGARADGGGGQGHVHGSHEFVDCGARGGGPA